KVMSLAARDQRRSRSAISPVWARSSWESRKKYIHWAPWVSPVKSLSGPQMSTVIRASLRPINSPLSVVPCYAPPRLALPYSATPCHGPLGHASERLCGQFLLAVHLAERLAPAGHQVGQHRQRPLLPVETLALERGQLVAPLLGGGGDTDAFPDPVAG